MNAKIKTKSALWSAPWATLACVFAFTTVASAQSASQNGASMGADPNLDAPPSAMQSPPPSQLSAPGEDFNAPQAKPSTGESRADGGPKQYEDLSVNPPPAKLQVNPKIDEESSRLRYLTLYVGVETPEILPRLPKDFVVKGDFRKIAKVMVSRESSTLLFEAKKEGVATLTIHAKNGTKLYEFRLDSRQSNLTKVHREIRALLADIQGITIKIVNNRVIVDGQVLLSREIDRIHSVVKQYNGLADSLVRPSPVAQKKIATMIQNQINNPEIQVTPINDKFVLEGWAGSKEEKDRAEIIAKLYVPDVFKTTAEADGVIMAPRKDFVINLIQLRQEAPPEPGKPIQLVVHYVELNKDYSKGFRFDWSPALSDGSQANFSSDSRSPGGVVSAITGTISNLIPKLNWARNHGYARVLESTSLIVLNKQKGDIKSVVNIPYQVTNAQGQPSTNFADTGMTSSVTPEILNARSDNVRLNLDFSVASLLGLTDKGPMISRNQMTTVVIVRSGQSAAVGGLISNTTSTNYNKLPRGASENPIISLYASKAFQRNQSQFVVFVTPIIKSSASAGSEKIKKKMHLTPD